MKSIILKLDDVKLNSKESRQWNMVFEYILAKKIKASAGIIGSSLKKENPEFFGWLKTINSCGNIEFWNHGFHHTKVPRNLFEFSGSTEKDQLDSISRTQVLGQKRLGITFSTFGAPYNRVDKNTADVLKKFPEIKVWFGGLRFNTQTSLVVNRKCEVFNRLTNSVGFFDFTFDYFINQYKEYKKNKKPYEVLQYHPGGWKDDKTVEEFYKIIDFLSEQPDVKFVTPSEYATENRP